MGKDGNWDIDPPGVRGVVLKTGEVARAIEGHGKTLSALVESAAASAGTIMADSVPAQDRQGGMGPVAGALAAYFQARGSQLAFLAARAGQSLQGAVEATTAYVNGDLEMAADAQRKALTAPEGFEAFRLPGKGPAVPPAIAAPPPADGKGAS
ncbi:hypothetical protein IHE55_16610 [Streptomyces pactum]|uniref:ESX-1 secretion-associated protein n=1 Tax=Streptomyces pactum TaxID=68249 RepID=A0ABS0NM88_9ACTN|nr:DUF6507 family protein [Streptomyces pactum]MBH5336309.1 hypothetical protein [Streptomyces pactum]